ncbi:MAG TPA: O-antigen ligase family protein [Burkholderiaceae bacterium]|jgi:O-antigen ligase
MSSGSAAGGWSRGRRSLEWAIVLAAAVGTGLILALMGGLALKYQVAAVAGLLLSGLVLMHRDRRLILVLLWVLVMPLGMEKVVDTGLSVGPEFSTQFIVFNAADVLLFLLAAVLLIEWHQTGVCPFVGSPFATVWALILVWSAVSYAIHAFYLRDGLVHVAPLSLLTAARTLLFIVLLQSSVRDRGELITVMLVLGGSLLLQSLVVMLSYATEEVYNLTRLTGGTTLKLTTFGGDGGGAVIRATGTLGYTNQQAAYHAFCTLPLLSLLALRNAAVRNAAIAVVCLSSIAIVLTFARGAWVAQGLAVIQAFGVFAWRRLITPAAWLKGALVALVACVALGALSVPIIERLTKGGDDGATDSRLRMIALAVELFEGNPVFGVGPGEYVEAGYRLEPVEDKAPEWEAPGAAPMVPPIGRLEVARAVHPDGYFITIPLAVHNRYLLSLSELGVPGLLLWLALFWIIVRACWRCASANDGFYRFLGIAGGAVTTGLLVYMMVDLFADDKSLQIMFLMPLLLCIAEQHQGASRSAVPA